MKTSELRAGVARLDITMRVTLGSLALASGVYTYLGVRELLDGSATTVFLAALIYSAAVSIGIYAFWSFLMRFLPHVRDMTSRALLTLAMALGSLMIVAMSSWLNAAALAGSAALEQHLATTLEAYVEDLDNAHNNALAAQSLLPDIQMASTRFARLADAEREGALTGSAGSGTVVQLLTQMSNQLDGLADEVRGSADRVKAQFEQGGAHIAKMRELVSANGPIKPRSDAFGAEAINLTGVIAAIQQTSVAAAVKRAADDLAQGFIAPVAGGRTADLADRQTAVMGSVERAVAAQSQALSQAAETILAAERVVPERFQPLSTAEAVLVYAGDFLPSWAGAISIDLLPAVLVLILCVVQAGIRREDDPAAATEMSAADLIAAMRLVREVENEGRVARTAPVPAEAEPAPAPEDAPVREVEPAPLAGDGKVTSLPPRGGRGE